METKFDPIAISPLRRSEQAKVKILSTYELYVCLEENEIERNDVSGIVGLLNKQRERD